MQWFCFFAIRSLSRHSGSVRHRRIEYTKLAPLISPPDWARVYGAVAKYPYLLSSVCFQSATPYRHDGESLVRAG